MVDDDTTVIAIPKEAGAPLGLNLANVGWWPYQRVAISSVTKASPAVGLLDEGAEIVSLNGVDIQGAAQAADLIRAAGGTLQLCVRNKPLPEATQRDEDTEIKHSSRQLPTRMLVAFACVVLVLAAINFASAGAARRAAAREDEAKSQAHAWRSIAKQEQDRLNMGRAQQRSLQKRAADLQRQIQRLKHANESVGERMVSTLASLRAQQRNVSAARKTWRKTQQQAQWQLRQAMHERDALSSTLAAEKARGSEQQSLLDAERSRAAASLRRERAILLKLRARMRQRLQEAVEEAEAMAVEGGGAPLAPSASARAAESDWSSSSSRSATASVGASSDSASSEAPCCTAPPSPDGSLHARGEHGHSEDGGAVTC